MFDNYNYLIVSELWLSEEILLEEVIVWVLGARFVLNTPKPARKLCFFSGR